MAMHPMRGSTTLVSAAVVVAWLAVSTAEAGDDAAFTPLGGIVEFDPTWPVDDWSAATDISADGSVVVGYARIGPGPDTREAFRWTAETGMVGLGLLPDGSHSAALAVSSNGAVVVGHADDSEAIRQAVRWTAAEGLTALGGLVDDPPFSSLSGAESVSANGTIITGWSVSPVHTDAGGNPTAEAFRWENGEMSGLGDLPGGAEFSWAFDLSDDGDAIVGLSSSAIGSEGFRWSATAGLVGLSSAAETRAIAISPDGSTIVGQVRLDQDGFWRAARWSGTNPLHTLGSLPGGQPSGRALAVSADGSVIAGHASSGDAPNPAFDEAFVWTAVQGMQNVRQLLLAHGVDEVKDWQVRTVRGISHDGNIIVGDGINPDGRIEAWVAALPADIVPGIPGDITGDGAVNVDDLLDVLNVWGACDDCNECVADINGDCEVNVDDLLTILNNWE